MRACLALEAERLVITMCPEMSDSPRLLSVIVWVRCRERHFGKELPQQTGKSAAVDLPGLCMRVLKTEGTVPHVCDLKS